MHHVVDGRCAWSCANIVRRSILEAMLVIASFCYRRYASRHRRQGPSERVLHFIRPHGRKARAHACSLHLHLPLQGASMVRQGTAFGVFTGSMRMYSNQAKQTLDLRSLALWARYLLLAKPYFTVDIKKSDRRHTGVRHPLGSFRWEGSSNWSVSLSVLYLTHPPSSGWNHSIPAPCAATRGLETPVSYLHRLRGNPRSFSLICLPRSRGCKLDIKRPQPNFSTQALGW